MCLSVIAASVCGLVDVIYFLPQDCGSKQLEQHAGLLLGNENGYSQTSWHFRHTVVDIQSTGTR